MPNPDKWSMTARSTISAGIGFAHSQVPRASRAEAQM
jgi:hypothetical protein